MALVLRRRPPADRARHPNEMDLRRIVRGIAARARYLYVTPEVAPIEGGYLVRSPCCSRNVDAGGGVIEVAQILWSGDPPLWRLLRRDHGRALWLEDSRFARLPEALARLNSDPERVFWQ